MWLKKLNPYYILKIIRPFIVPKSDEKTFLKLINKRFIIDKFNPLKCLNINDNEEFKLCWLIQCIINVVKLLILMVI